MRAKGEERRVPALGLSAGLRFYQDVPGSSMRASWRSRNPSSASMDLDLSRSQHYI